MAKTATQFILTTIAFCFPGLAQATSVSVRVTDQTGAGIANVLLITRSIDGYGEQSYSLSDSQGQVARRDLTPGIYQLIATQPYGLWKSHIQEFLVKDVSLNMEVTLEALPTHGLGDVVVVAPEIDVTILDRKGKPASEAELFARDADAKFGKWYKAGKEGKVRVQSFGQGIVFVTSYMDALAIFRPHEPDHKPGARDETRQRAQTNSPTDSITLRIP